VAADLVAAIPRDQSDDQAATGTAMAATPSGEWLSGRSARLNRPK
jgi:hypothetical protein